MGWNSVNFNNGEHYYVYFMIDCVPYCADCHSRALTGVKKAEGQHCDLDTIQRSKTAGERPCAEGTCQIERVCSSEGKRRYTVRQNNQ